MAKDVPLILYVTICGPDQGTCTDQYPCGKFLHIFPQTQYKDLKFPHDSVRYIYPNGITFVQEKSTEKRIHYFNFPTICGKQIFAISC